MSDEEPRSLSRRRTLAKLGMGATSLVGSVLAASRVAAKGPAKDREVPFRLEEWVARPPEGFLPWSAPGLVAKAEAKGDFASMMQANYLWPKPDVARRLVERALTDLTGAPSALAAMARFIHPSDRVAIKVNGIAGQNGYTVAVNYEVILPVVEAVLAVGVPPQNVTVYEQYPTFLMGTRVNVRNWKLPPGVRTGTHNNQDHEMPRINVVGSIPTRYCTIMTDATAVIDMTMMKEHHLCGFTGALKNITHGSIENPHDHHEGQASPQIALLYNHPIVTSRVRLHIADAFKIIYDKGPLDKDPRMRAAHGAVYASTDPVALDTIGWRVIDAERLRRGGMTLQEGEREPRYIRRAAELGLGVHDEGELRLRTAII